MGQSIFEEIERCPHWHDLPPSVSRAVAIVDEHDETHYEALVEAIEETPELADIILKYMNSPLYALPARVVDIKSAVVNLGYEIIRNFLARYMTVYILKGKRRDRPAFNMKEYWRHALSTCIAAGLLGEKIGFENRFRLFTYGLIHDIGFVILESCFPEKLDAIYQKLQEGVPLIVAEKAVLGGATHAEIGAWLCRRWHLDAQGTDIVQYHHTPLLASRQTKELELLYLGNIIGMRVYEDRMKIHFGDRTVDRQALDQLGLSETDIADVDNEIDAQLEWFERQYIFNR